MLYDEEGEESNEFFEGVQYNIENVWDHILRVCESNDRLCFI